MDDSAGEGSDQTRHGSGRRILPDLTGLDLLGSGVLVLDVEGRVAFANMAACQLLAMTPRRMRGCTPGELLPDLQALDAPLDQLRSQAWGQQGVDITLMRPGQPPLALHCLAVVLEDTGGMLLVAQEALRELNPGARGPQSAGGHPRGSTAAGGRCRDGRRA